MHIYYTSTHTHMVFSGKGYVRQCISVMLALGKHLHVAFVHVPHGGKLPHEEIYDQISSSHTNDRPTVWLLVAQTMHAPLSYHWNLLLIFWPTMVPRTLAPCILHLHWPLGLQVSFPRAAGKGGVQWSTPVPKSWPQGNWSCFCLHPTGLNLSLGLTEMQELG